MRRISANAIQALKDALTAAFWFKRDLYSFAKAAVGGEPLFLSGIGWTDDNVYKRDSVSTFVDRLVREQDTHQELLLALLVDVAAMDDFPNLRHLEDADAKIAEATAAVQRLRTHTQPYEQELVERQRTREQINANKVQAAERRGTAERLEELKQRYMDHPDAAPATRICAGASTPRSVRCV